MYRGERAAGGSKGEVGSVDRKRINEALDKQLERSSPSTSRAINGKDKSSQSLQMGKHPPDNYRDSRSASLPKANASGGIKINITTSPYFDDFRIFSL